MDNEPAPQPGVPSPEQQSWGLLISIVVIVLMVVIGAFYAWDNRIKQEKMLYAPAVSQ